MVLDVCEPSACSLSVLAGLNFLSVTCSLHLLLKAIGVANGDEVITEPNSFVASTSTIALTGTLPLFVDVTDGLNIDTVKIE